MFLSIISVRKKLKTFYLEYIVYLLVYIEVFKRMFTKDLLNNVYKKELKRRSD
jgi:hypothetical protein